MTQPRRNLRVAIVDDEAHSRDAMKVLLGRRRDVEIVAVCRNGAEAVDMLRSLPVDVLFLDVQMPVLDGFGVLRTLDAEHRPHIVFVTGFEGYALQAFDVEAVDYVLKPLDQPRFFAALERARRRSDESRDARHARRLLAAEPGGTASAVTDHVSKIRVRVGNRLVLLDVDSIDWIEAADQYVILHVADRKFLLRASISGLSQRLRRERFVRIHRSHLINVTKVREVVRLSKGDARVTLTDGRQLRLSRRYRREFVETLESGL